jgi:glycogen synthase
MMHSVLHLSLEYTYGVGGLRSVITGLIPALDRNDMPVSIITPFYDFLENLDLELEELTTVKHCYKRTIHTSIILKTKHGQLNTEQIDLFLIKPPSNSPVAYIFNIADQQNIYKAFNHSEPQNRIEYFNGAVSSFIRILKPNIPCFDIIHAHSWHTGLSVCLTKEFENLEWVKNINPEVELKTPPKIISSIHMLSNEQGVLIGKQNIVDTLTSVGLPLKRKFLNNDHLNQMYLGMQYSDQVLMVSKNIVNDAISGKDYGLGKIFKFLHSKNRLNAISNGIVTEHFNPTLMKNLGSYAISIDHQHSIIEQKRKIKHFLSSKYKQLYERTNNIWYLYLGRFAKEKGIDLLPSALESISETKGNLIVIGCYVTDNKIDKNCFLQETIEKLKDEKNVVVIDSIDEQKSIGKYFRAACEFTLIPSHIEACGLIAMEAMLNCSIPIASDVQGLPDTVIPFIEDKHYNNEYYNTEGTGFLYHEDDLGSKENLQKIIKVASYKYRYWEKQKILDLILAKLYHKSIKFDWQESPVKNYLSLYQKTIETETTSHPFILEKLPKITVLHVALEYRQASLGGLGMITTELVDAQNKFNQGDCFDSSIITPYYPIFEQNYQPATFIDNITHLYNNEEVNSAIYLINHKNNKHYLIKPQIEYNHLFNVDSPCQIYTTDSTFIESIKYFNSATASFIINKTSTNNLIIQLHDWTSALTAAILRQFYKNYNIKLIYNLHINNKDRGTYLKEQLSGIGLQLENNSYILKQMGICCSDYVIAVSKGILEDCCIYQADETKELARSFLIAKYNNKATAILNGIDYNKSSKIKNLNNRHTDLVSAKKQIKEQLAKSLTSSFSTWKIDANLPIILYIGRFSPEKGIEYFKTLIATIEGKATFFALGRGFTKEILELIMQNSRQKNNVFITFSTLEQEKYGDLMRAAADFTFVPSHEEACGLVAMEGLANGSICITSGVGGLKDFINPFKYNGQEGSHSGNGFFYQDRNENSFVQTINFALDLWQSIPSNDKNLIHARIMQEAKRLDWLAKNGATEKYADLFQHILAFQESKNHYRLNMF